MDRADGATAASVAEDLEVSAKTVNKWRSSSRQWVRRGCPTSLVRGERPIFHVSQRYGVIALACDTPVYYGHAQAPRWTHDLLREVAAREVEGPAMGRSSIHRTLPKHG